MEATNYRPADPTRTGSRTSWGVRLRPRVRARRCRTHSSDRPAGLSYRAIAESLNKYGVPTGRRPEVVSGPRARSSRAITRAVHHGPVSTGFDVYGCEYCADSDNRQFGHLDQLCDESGGVLLLRCPLCSTFYRADDATTRLTVSEADTLLPPPQRTVVPGDP